MATTGAAATPASARPAVPSGSCAAFVTACSTVCVTDETALLNQLIANLDWVPGSRTLSALVSVN